MRLFLQLPELFLRTPVGLLAFLTLALFARPVLFLFALARLGLFPRPALGLDPRLAFGYGLGLGFLERFHGRFHARTGVGIAAHGLHGRLHLGFGLRAGGRLGARLRFRDRLFGRLGACLGLLTRLALALFPGPDLALNLEPLLGFLLGARFRPRQCFLEPFELGVDSRLGLGFGLGQGLRFGFGARPSLRFFPGFCFRGRLLLGFGFGSGLGLCAGLRFRIGARFLLHRGLDPCFSLRPGLGVGRCLGLCFRLGPCLGCRLGRSLCLQLRFRFRFGLGLGHGTGARFGFLPDFCFRGGPRRGLRPGLGLRFRFRSRLGLGIELGHCRGRGEIQILALIDGCGRSGGNGRQVHPRSGTRLLRSVGRGKDPDVAVRDQFIDRFLELFCPDAGFTDQVGKSRLAVDRDKHHPEIAGQLYRLVLDFQDAFGRLGEHGLWMHNLRFFRVLRYGAMSSGTITHLWAGLATVTHRFEWISAGT